MITYEYRIVHIPNSAGATNIETRQNQLNILGSKGFYLVMRRDLYDGRLEKNPSATEFIFERKVEDAMEVIDDVAFTLPIHVNE